MNKKIIAMKLYKSVLLLLLAALFVCAISKGKKTFEVANEKGSTTSNGRSNFLRNISQEGRDSASHEVEFTFTGNLALYGTPEDCGLFSPDTVTLKGILTGNENVDSFDNVRYIGVLHLKINMAVCNVRRDKNGEDHWCVMSVNGEGPVMTELEIDTAAGYGYIKINYDSTDATFRSLFGVFKKNVHGTCDPQEMKEEEDDNVPNNTIAAIFNGLELRCLKNRPILRKGECHDTGPNGTTVVNVIN